MSQAYVGEIRAVGFTFAPSGWALCNGQLLPISEYDALFNLLGTTYGGDGQNTFALPDLRGRTPIHMGTGSGTTFITGQVVGAEKVTLNAGQVAAHSHVINASTGTGDSGTPAGSYFASASASYYSLVNSGLPTAVILQPAAAAPQPHSNLQPYLCVNYAISLYGIFPSRN